MISEIKISNYTYDLPENRIALFPLEERDSAKLLVYKEGKVQHANFAKVTEFLPEKTLLVFNNTRVVQARLLFTKTAGAKPIEVFCLEPHLMDVESAMAVKQEVFFHCLVGNAKRWNEGLKLDLKLEVNAQEVLFRAEKVERVGDSFIIRFTWDGDASFAEILEHAGKVPLPPYLKRQSEASDKDRYQTVYAKTNGSVAAPTAGLHFTEAVLKTLKAKGIKLAETTLHVGAGTFKPVSKEDVREHDMHAEELHISVELLDQIIAHEGPLLCVGTTSARTLESVYWLGVKCMHESGNPFLKLNQWDAYDLPQDVPLKTALENLKNYIAQKKTKHFFTTTQLIITPGYTFRVIHGLFTNFHQPGSTLILLVAAAVGQNWRMIYEEAMHNDYRFLSYGDSSLLFIEQYEPK